MVKSVLGVVALAMLVACGEGGSLPPTQSGIPADGTPPLDADGGTTPAALSLWPLTTGSHWVYSISDDQRGAFEKRVEVLGLERVPGSQVDAIHVRSVQPHLEEHSYQAMMDGLVVRLREDDHKEGALVRSTTWNPATVKAVSASVESGWTHSSLVKERTGYSDGTFEEKERTYQWRVLETNVSVTTPAGTFDNAIKLERSRPDKEDWVRVYWLVPGIGKVREEGERTEELTEFHIAEE